MIKVIALLSIFVATAYSSWLLPGTSTDIIKDTVGAKFTCPPLPKRKNLTKKTVHQLRPDDINVIAALGDSITAAFIARSKTFDVSKLYEYTGVSFSIGGSSGDATKTATLPNFIKFYNPHLKGQSCVTRQGQRCTAEGTNEQIHLNVALSGATSGLLLRQAMTLKNTMIRLHDTGRIDFEEDWKVITLWIGGNDLCASCPKPSQLPLPPKECDYDNITVHNFLQDVFETLSYLKENVPKAFVNLVNVVDISALRPLVEDESCVLLPIECKCIEDEDISTMAKELQRGMREIADKDSLTTDTFTVVLQPFFETMTLPPKPKEFFAPDCFHFDTDGHATAAVSLWNNMLEPVGKKSRGLVTDLTAKCPSAENNYYFYTKKNSFNSKGSDSRESGDL